MSDLEELKELLKKIGIENKFEEVLAKKNVFGPTTKLINNKLIWLDLSNFGIKELPDQLFDNLSNLQELKLFKNEIKIIPLNLFDKLPNLTEIHLKDNKIQKVTRIHFMHQGKLQRLFLGGNPLPENQAQNYTNGIEVRNFLNELPE